MYLALGAASSAIDALKALTSSRSSSQTNGVGKNSENPFALMSSNVSASSGAEAATGSTGGGNYSPISPETMSALLDAQSQSSNASSSASKSRHNALKDLFGQIDGDGDGKISKSEFEEALGAGGTNLANADSVFGKLDKDGDGSVSLKELASALRPGKARHHTDEANGGASASDPLSQLTQGASTTSVTNSDGSVTTSLTYADGSKVTMTSAASGNSSSAATSSYNFIEQMIQRQAQAISASTAASVSMSA